MTSEPAIVLRRLLLNAEGATISSAYLVNLLSANVDNEELDDANFREMIRRLLPLAQVMTPEIPAAAQHLIQLIEAEERSGRGLDAEEARKFADEILSAANVNGLGGCPLCQR